MRPWFKFKIFKLAFWQAFIWCIRVKGRVKLFWCIFGIICHHMENIISYMHRCFVYFRVEREWSRCCYSLVLGDIYLPQCSWDCLHQIWFHYTSAALPLPLHPGINHPPCCLCSQWHSSHLRMCLSSWIFPLNYIPNRLDICSSICGFTWGESCLVGHGCCLVRFNGTFYNSAKYEPHFSTEFCVHTDNSSSFYAHLLFVCNLLWIKVGRGKDWSSKTWTIWLWHHLKNKRRQKHWKKLKWKERKKFG